MDFRAGLGLCSCPYGSFTWSNVLLHYAFGVDRSFTHAMKKAPELKTVWAPKVRVFLAQPSSR